MLGRVTTQQFPAPTFDSQGDTGKLVFSDYLNFFLLDFKNDLGAVIKALQIKGLFQSLAEPNLVSESGKEASFLAGGEIPVPIAQPSGGGDVRDHHAQEFGIRLNFTPIINGDRVHLKVRPEVSTLDFAQRRDAAGLPRSGAVDAPHRDRARAAERPDVRDRRADQQHDEQVDAEDPGHRRHPDPRPICSSSQAAQKDQTELVVMITPEILPRMSPGVTSSLPRIVRTVSAGARSEDVARTAGAGVPSRCGRHHPGSAAVAPAPAARADARGPDRNRDTEPGGRCRDAAGADAVDRAGGQRRPAAVASRRADQTGAGHKLTREEQAALDQARKQREGRGARRRGA